MVELSECSTTSFVQVQVWALRGMEAKKRGEVAEEVVVRTGGYGWVVEAVGLLVPLGE